jgi:hypothetical protein
MRKPLLLGVLGLALLGCIAHTTLRGSSSTFLTPAGAQVTVNRQSSAMVPALQQLFAERGFQFVSQAQPRPDTQVLFFKGSRALVTSQNNTSDSLYAAGGQIGSWFAVRVVEVGYKSTVSFYGKPTLGDQEVCSDGDDQLRDVQYRCTNTQVRSDWPGFALVEGREETQVISGLVTTLAQRFP